MTTIIDILADLEAKAERVALGSLESTKQENWAEFHTACSPDRILALVSYVRRLIEAGRAVKKNPDGPRWHDFYDVVDEAVHLDTKGEKK